jgi:hypothetical protein
MVYLSLQTYPWNYADSWTTASDRIFLQKVGGGYIFIHRLLMEHFAACQFEKRREVRAIPTDSFASRTCCTSHHRKLVFFR